MDARAEILAKVREHYAATWGERSFDPDHASVPVSGRVFVWNLATDERPSVVVVAESAADVAHAVRYARSWGMRIAPQGTGHGSEPLEPLEGEVERTVIDQEDFLRLALDGARYSLAVAGAEDEGLEDQEVEGALEEGDAVVVALLGRHTT